MAHDILNTADLAQFGIPISTAAKMRTRGDGPPYLKIGRRIRYRRADVEAWLEAHRVMSVAAARVRERGQ